MDQTEIFELCENSAKHQCLDCNAFSEIGIIYCSCGRFQYTIAILLQSLALSSRRIPVEDQNGASERQVMFFKAKQMLKKARQSKHGSHPTIFQGGTNKKDTESLAEHNIGEKEVMLFDRIALERHDYTATKAERLQNAKHCILRLSADGPQKPLRDQNLLLH